MTIVAELYMREMGARQFYETIGGSSYASVRRHFLKLVEHGWLRKARTASAGALGGRPEALYRSTELAVIDDETWHEIPVSIRDAIMVQLLEEIGGRLGEALEQRTSDARPDGIAVFRTIEVDERAWCEAQRAVERCFKVVLDEQTDAKIRLDRSTEDPLLMVVNLAAFEAPGRTLEGFRPLPRASVTSPPPPWPQRVGRVFADRLDLEIVDELNRSTLTPAELRARLGGSSNLFLLRRCMRLTDLGWVVNTETGGSDRRQRTYRFRAAAPAVSESDIYELIPGPVRMGRTWEAFKPFVETTIAAVNAGSFNNRFDPHLTMTPLLLDGIAWAQVTKALRGLEETLERLEVELAKRRGRAGFSGFQAAFLVSSFQAPQREPRR
ncbi:MAG: hypothetical protein JSS68_09110 [Actinobacteria bacterium]|nr:hypothetical protein [Actinomycetota bacterium]